MKSSSFDSSETKVARSLAPSRAFDGTTPKPAQASMSWSFSASPKAQTSSGRMPRLAVTASTPTALLVSGFTMTLSGPPGSCIVDGSQRRPAGVTARTACVENGSRRRRRHRADAGPRRQKPARAVVLPDPDAPHPVHSLRGRDRGEEVVDRSFPAQHPLEEVGIAAFDGVEVRLTRDGDAVGGVDLRAERDAGHGSCDLLECRDHYVSCRDSFKYELVERVAGVGDGAVGADQRVHDGAAFAQVARNTSGVRLAASRGDDDRAVERRERRCRRVRHDAGAVAQRAVEVQRDCTQLTRSVGCKCSR